MRVLCMAVIVSLHSDQWRLCTTIAKDAGGLSNHVPCIEVHLLLADSLVLNLTRATCQSMDVSQKCPDSPIRDLDIHQTPSQIMPVALSRKLQC